MKPMPRKLKLLIIDDELARSYHGYKVPESIGVWSLGENLPGIDSWRTALQFWTSFDFSEVPDLVLADVRFIEDRTSPLSMLFKPDENYIPTGISHLKPFAALSRILGKPLGVCTRTIDPRVWEDLIASPRQEKRPLDNWLLYRAMGYLAAHEIGELAAILGDGKEILADKQDRQQHVRNCYQWLQNNSATVFEEGVQKAVMDYRRSLYRLLTMPGTPSIFVRPSAYAELMGWCERMRRDPQPLNIQNDFGLELTYHNGKRDYISVASLFADYERITSKALEPSSFALDEFAVIDKPWKLDDDARPRIGAYLQKLGSLKTACNSAAEAVMEYDDSDEPPENYQPRTLALLKSNYGYSALTTGLIVLFQFVRIEQGRIEQWEHSFEQDSWNPTSLQFVSAYYDPTDSLQLTLQKLIDLIRKYYAKQVENEFTRMALFDEFPEGWVRKINIIRGDQDSEWVKWHFQRLVDAQILKCRVKGGEDYYTLNSDWLKKRPLLHPPPAPRRFPRIVDKINKDARRELNRVQQLKISLGYEKNDFNSVERVIADAFGGLGIKKYTDNDRVKVGAAILKQFEEPDLPFFLLETCREYATEYLEWPPEKWPMWLRTRTVSEEE